MRFQDFILLYFLTGLIIFSLNKMYKARILIKKTSNTIKEYCTIKLEDVHVALNKDLEMKSEEEIAAMTAIDQIRYVNAYVDQRRDIFNFQFHYMEVLGFYPRRKEILFRCLDSLLLKDTRNLIRNDVLLVEMNDYVETVKKSRPDIEKVLQNMSKDEILLQ